MSSRQIVLEDTRQNCLIELELVNTCVPEFHIQCIRLEELKSYDGIAQ